MKDVKAGQKERSVLSAYDVKDAEIWDAFKKEMEEVAIARQDAELHIKNPSIRNFLRIKAVQLIMEA